MIIKAPDLVHVLKNFRAIIGFNYCDQFYKIKKELKDKESYSSDENYYKIRFEIRAEKLVIIIDDLISSVKKDIKDILIRNPFRKAFDYAKKQYST